MSNNYENKALNDSMLSDFTHDFFMQHEGVDLKKVKALFYGGDNSFQYRYGMDYEGVLSVVARNSIESTDFDNNEERRSHLEAAMSILTENTRWHWANDDPDVTGTRFYEVLFIELEKSQKSHKEFVAARA